MVQCLFLPDELKMLSRLYEAIRVESQQGGMGFRNSEIQQPHSAFLTGKVGHFLALKQKLSLEQVKLAVSAGLKRSSAERGLLPVCYICTSLQILTFNHIRYQGINPLVHTSLGTHGIILLINLCVHFSIYHNLFKTINSYHLKCQHINKRVFSHMSCIYKRLLSPLKGTGVLL